MKLKDIAIAINKQLKSEFPSIPIHSKDISEGFPRPSFFVDFETSTREQLSSRRIERTLPVVIYYFPTDRYQNKIELLDVQEGLEEVFKDELVIVDTDRLYMGKSTSVKVDGVLQLSFDIHYVEISGDGDNDSNEYMNTLIMKG